MWFSIISGFLVDVSGILMLVEFGGILGLVELGRLFRCRVDISGNFRLVDPGGFFRFWFRV